MAKSNNWTVKDLQDKNLVEHNGKFVNVKTLVDPKPDKLKAFQEKQKEDIEAWNAKYPVLGTPKELRNAMQYTYNDSDFVLERYTTKIKIKPMSVNVAWRGTRYKTPQYNKYQREVLSILPDDLIVPEGLLKVYYEFGMSKSSDLDNPVKPLQDILQKKYNFNDSRIMEAYIKKVIVKKGQEYITFRFESL
jgi:Holliday junction resolvase RusA-like endonuclease